MYLRDTAIWADAKGTTDAHVVQALTRIHRLLGFDRFYVRSDPENAATSLAHHIASNGRVEQLHGTLRGITRTVLCDVERKYSAKIPLQHPTIPCSPVCRPKCATETKWIRFDTRRTSGRMCARILDWSLSESLCCGRSQDHSNTNFKNPGGTGYTWAESPKATSDSSCGDAKSGSADTSS